MDNKQAYDLWSKQYDSIENKTRDLEAKAIKEALDNIEIESCLEIGCGTGKNTEWLLQKANYIMAIDFSEEMLSRAKKKINSDKVNFLQADITKEWNFTDNKFDIVTFSLVLEHIEDLDHIFKEAAKVIQPGGYVYIGELHPFKQYKGTKARFETKEGLQILDCHTHNISDFIQSALRKGFEIKDLNEFWDDDRSNGPGVVMILLKKN
jgi:ubiquinone/menaquinone biosynthesis C-methylase UbiE